MSNDKTSNGKSLVVTGTVISVIAVCVTLIIVTLKIASSASAIAADSMKETIEVREKVAEVENTLSTHISAQIQHNKSVLKDIKDMKTDIREDLRDIKQELSEQRKDIKDLIKQ